MHQRDHTFHSSPSAINFLLPMLGLTISSNQADKSIGNAAANAIGLEPVFLLPCD